ncbi:MAG: glucose 1-dehydrogenase [Dehalococcoidia bacterium]|nr:glucose 1-dehydrogenase [Dehalococcoidia bacterium]
MGRLEDKVAIITGAARGNGEGAARVMAREGAIVVLTDILDQVHETAKNIREHGYKAFSFRMDVTKPAEVNHIVQEVLKQFGRVDILVNNAGVARLVALIDLSDEIRDNIFDVNVKGAFICTKAVLPSMIKQKYGEIINISSVTGPLVSDPGQCAYAATKGALWGFTKALAIEVAQYSINVNAICPGVIETEMVKQGAAQTNPKDPESVLKQLPRGIPMGRLGTIEELGELVAFLASDESKYITGTSIVIDGGSTLPETGALAPA